MKQQRPKKLENVLELAKQCIEKGSYVATFHAECRQLEREITLLDAVYVIKNGYRAPKYDNFKEEWDKWNYAINGMTTQKENIRVIISFEDDKFNDTEKLLIITVINLSKD